MLKKLKFNIQGMTCVVCSGSCQKAIEKLDGVKSCNVNFASGVALVEYDEEKVGEKEIYGAVEKAGYKLAGSPRFSYIDGIWNKDSEEEWLTEIQIPAGR